MNKELLAHLEGYLTPRRRQLFDQVLAERTNHFTVATEDVYQLHNTSAVIRSCDVFGVQNVHITEERNITPQKTVGKHYVQKDTKLLQLPRIMMLVC